MHITDKARPIMADHDAFVALLPDLDAADRRALGWEIVKAIGDWEAQFTLLDDASKRHLRHWTEHMDALARETIALILDAERKGA